MRRPKTAGPPARTGILVAALALAAMVLGGAGCDPNSDVPLLTPSGERPLPPIGVLTGQLDFGAPGPGLPEALVLLARVGEAGCVSAFTTIQVVGTNTEPDFTIPGAPALTPLGGCTWVDTLTIESGEMLWKFVTNGAFDNPPDYGGNEGTTLALVAGEEFDCNQVTGTGTALKADVPAGLEGLVVCTLAEKTGGAGTFRFDKPGDAGGGGAFSSAADGTFEFRDLIPGVYNVEIRAPGFAAIRINNVTVGVEPADLGVIPVGANTGTISGAVAFEGAPVPPDTATVQLRPAGTTTVERSLRTTGAFAFERVAEGSYDLMFRATGYRDSLVANVAVVADQTTNVGTVTLRRRPTGPTIVIDGSLDAGYGAALAVQQVQTEFGDSDLGLVAEANGSELDVAHGVISNGYLYVFLGGNLESNFNKLDIFIDSRPGEGQNKLRGNNPDVDFNGLNRMGDDGSGNGLRFDAEFAADHYLTASLGDGGTGSILAYVSYGEILTAGGGAGRYLGQAVPGGDGTLTGGANPDGIRFTVDNRNTGGVTAGNGAASGAGVTTGIEFAIPLSALGDPTGCVKVVAFINGLGHDYVSNQVLGPLSPPASSLGESRLVSFPDQAGDQFFEVCEPAAPRDLLSRRWSRGGSSR